MAIRGKRQCSWKCAGEDPSRVLVILDSPNPSPRAKSGRVREPHVCSQIAGQSAKKVEEKLADTVFEGLLEQVENHETRRFIEVDNHEAVTSSTVRSSRTRLGG